MPLSDLPTLADDPRPVRQKYDEPSRHDRKAAQKAEAEATWRSVCKLVDARDGKACRCCDRRSDPDASGLLTRGHRHHLIYRSAQGPDESWNLLTLCHQCHHDEHHNKLRIEGGSTPVDANTPLTFWRKDEAGVWFMVREEMAVRVVRKD